MPSLKQQVNSSGTQAILGLGALEQIKFNQDGTVEIPNLPAKLDTANAFGVGQSWQDVTASRAPNVTYTNSTAKTIYLKIWSIADTSAQLDIYVNGVPVESVAFNSSSTGRVSASAIVPSGGTYSCTPTSTTIERWLEFRG